MVGNNCGSFLTSSTQTLADKDSDVSETESAVVNKERKKITFADEAGEKLCHVKFFEKNSSDSLDADTEKPNQ